MEVLQAIHARRSVKHFDASHQISANERQTILEAARQAPSSFNIQHWRLLDVQNIELRQKLREASWNQAQVTDASMLLIVCVDWQAHTQNPQQYWRNAPTDVQNMLVGAIEKFYFDNPQLQRDEAMRSAGLIGQTIMLAAKGVGYDSCPMIGLEFDKVEKLIQLPKNHEIAMMIAIGRQTQPAREKGGFIDAQDFLKIDKFT